jgi:predicted Rossmann fold nucleotide-binding protein DprA/Smf involved in DNA uptake
MNKQLTGRMIITYLAIKYNNRWDYIYEAIKAKELVDHQSVVDAIDSIKGTYVCIIDSNYPDALKKISFPPFVVFLHESDRQNINDLSSNAYLKHFDIADAMIGA